VFWGSGEVFKENLKNWQANFFQIATFFAKNVNAMEWHPYEEKRRE
jgi:hypothetical protein